MCLVAVSVVQPRNARDYRSTLTSNAENRKQVQSLTIPGLMARGPAPHLQDKLKLFGQFVGDWAIRDEEYLDSGKVVRGTGHIRVGWILNGTATQDVWTVHANNPPPGEPAFDFGTTIRFYDPKINAWRCTWVAPPDGAVITLLGRQVGQEIVLETKTKEGYPDRWIFSEITRQSFHWHSQKSLDGGKTWVITENVYAKRMNSAGPRSAVRKTGS
jgi:hypothetical protein